MSHLGGGDFELGTWPAAALGPRGPLARAAGKHRAGYGPQTGQARFPEYSGGDQLINMSPRSSRTSLRHPHVQPERPPGQHGSRYHVWRGPSPHGEGNGNGLLAQLHLRLNPTISNVPLLTQGHSKTIQGSRHSGGSHCTAGSWAQGPALLGFQPGLFHLKGRATSVF